MHSVWQACFICFSWIILVLALVTSVEGKFTFSYEDQYIWGVQFPACNGQRQSPIAIKSQKTELDRNLKLEFKQYDEQFIGNNYYWINDGHTLKLVKNNIANTHIIKGTAVQNKQYRFKQLHMHWGQRSDQGSEHSIDGIHYPLEMHLVHEILDPSKENENKLVVIALFFVLGKENEFLKNTLFDNHGFHDLTITMRKVNIFPNEDKGLVDVLPRQLESFFVYNGSLTTPECDETVRWIIFKDIQEMSEDQLNSIRKLFDFPSNSRSLQQKYSRTVYSSDRSPMRKFAPHLSSAKSKFLISNLLYAFGFIFLNFSLKFCKF